MASCENAKRRREENALRDGDRIWVKIKIIKG